MAYLGVSIVLVEHSFLNEFHVHLSRDVLSVVRCYLLRHSGHERSRDLLVFVAVLAEDLDDFLNLVLVKCASESESL